MGIVVNHYQDPYKTTSISWKVSEGLFHGSDVFRQEQSRQVQWIFFRSPFRWGSLSFDEKLRTSAFLKADNDRNNMLETGEAACKRAS